MQTSCCVPTFSGKAPALRDAVSMLCDVAETVADLKDCGTVHRDLKPENILLLGGRWCLADFGIARYTEATTAKLTFKLAGTFTYMAPERWDNQRATTARDIYALCVPAHELLEGSIPFTGPADIDFAKQYLRGTPSSLLTTAPASGRARRGMPL
ncbi:protein kinase [Streptomyces sp. NPDC059743]|uniref:protein kinase domain-containing protein n=1 Tax=Streptomyces sp. NPDC059743 TaxID=3346928 RepID=UPI00364AF184